MFVYCLVFLFCLVIRHLTYLVYISATWWKIEIIEMKWSCWKITVMIQIKHQKKSIPAGKQNIQNLWNPPRKMNGKKSTQKERQSNRKAKASESTNSKIEREWQIIDTKNKGSAMRMTNHVKTPLREFFGGLSNSKILVITCPNIYNHFSAEYWES